MRSRPAASRRRADSERRGPRARAHFFRVEVLRARVVDFLAAPLFARVEEDFARVEDALARVEAGFSASLRAAPTRVAADFPACLTASPAAFAADFTPVAAPRADLRAWSAASRASFACRVDAAFLPDAADELRCWLRFLVAAAFFAAAERSAFV
jgi:hypothetical protein